MELVRTCPIWVSYNLKTKAWPAFRSLSIGFKFERFQHIYIELHSFSIDLNSLTRCENGTRGYEISIRTSAKHTAIEGQLHKGVCALGSSRGPSWSHEVLCWSQYPPISRRVCHQVTSTYMTIALVLKYWLFSIINLLVVEIWFGEFADKLRWMLRGLALELLPRPRAFSMHCLRRNSFCLVWCIYLFYTWQPFDL